MAFDLNSIDVVAASEEGIEVTIRHPVTDEDTDLVIKVKGFYAEEFREKLSRAVAKDEARNKAASRARRDDSQPNAVDEMARVLASQTIGWTGMQENGKDVAFSVKEAERVYVRYPIVRQQVWEAATTVGNFIKG